jgi:hypothetical protein
VYNARGSLERIRELRVRRTYSGHGPAITDVASNLEAALARIDAFIEDPRRMALHGMRRVFVYAVMLHGGLPQGGVLDYLRGTLWFPEFCVQYFEGQAPETVADRLLTGLLDSGALAVRDGMIVSTALAGTGPAAP